MTHTYYSKNLSDFCLKARIFLGNFYNCNAIKQTLPEVTEDQIGPNAH